MISRYCRHCDHEYRLADLDDSGLCFSCEQEALNRFNLPSVRDAFAIVLLVALVFAILILLGSHADWI